MARKAAATADIGAEETFDGVQDHSSEKVITLEWMADYLAKSPNAGSCISYVFRLEPVIDMRRVTGPKGQINIEKVSGAPTRNHLLAKHGNGVYQVSFHDMSRVRERRRVGLATIEIQEPGFHPICDPATVVWEEPRNRPYIAQLQTLGQLPPGVSFGGNGGGLHVVPPAAPVASLNAQVDDALALADKLRPAAAGGMTDSVVMPMLRHLSDTNIHLMERLRDTEGGRKSGGADDLLKQIELFKALGWGPPGTAGPVAVAPAAAAAPAAIADGGGVLQYLPYVADIVTSLRDVVGMVMGGGGGGEPAANEPAASHNEPMAANEPAASHNEPAAVAVPITEEENMLSQLQAFAGPAFNAFKSRVEPGEFVRQVVAAPGGLDALRAVSQIGLTEVKVYLKFVPNLSNELVQVGRSRAELDAFITEVLRLAVASVSGPVAPVAPVATGGRRGRA